MPNNSSNKVVLRHGSEQEYIDRVNQARRKEGGEIFVFRKRRGDWEEKADEFIRWAVWRRLARKIELGEDDNYRFVKVEYVF